jgi:UDP-glucuronate 4-epimerase
MTILVTGVAGFIGMHVAKQLLLAGEEVVGVDSINDYYDIKLKEDRLGQLYGFKSFYFEKFDLTDLEKLKKVMNAHRINKIIHLAAQAGVRYSIQNPAAYASSNLFAFLNILEASRYFQIEHLVYASSSSVYGGNTKTPYNESDPADHPVSLYAATKKSNELMAHTYSHLFNIPTTGLRFFTVYGPWGRPDMSPMLFARAIYEKRPINVFNYGKMKRDFTYIDDIVEGVIRVLAKPAKTNNSFNPLSPEPSSSSAPWRIFNIGNHEPIELGAYINILENIIGIKANINYMQLQPGDVVETYADVSKLYDWVGFNPNTKLEDGMLIFIQWLAEYYQYNLPNSINKCLEK